MPSPRCVAKWKPSAMCILTQSSPYLLSNFFSLFFALFLYPSTQTFCYWTAPAFSGFGESQTTFF
ncbi:hypothetical protein M413DRAFT_193398 [Hebeloma cylindrosporum]|uniref:Uncharacterized protein n=1 Tax=Hebeloma cylindrosporum TaxID=76867 RepID=A0A0C3C7L3_HEBCY|nr:hypothetical protein M413DRAFT_193398 [Hebeloma cylindrosporum h7]